MKQIVFRISALLIAAVLMVSFGQFSVCAQVPDSLCEEMAESVRTNQELEVSQYGLTQDQLEQVYYDLILSGRLPWYADQKFTCHLSENSGTVATFVPEILDPQLYSWDLYEQTVAEILNATVKEGMEPWEKALSIHDYLIANFAYDEQQTYRYGYDLLVNGSGVCSSYAYAYMDLMNRVGVPCRIVESKTMGMGTGHSWNLIQLDGNWYHVDLTWDDPTPNIQGRVMHKYFLLTDEEMHSEAEEGHFGWESHIVCDGPVKTGIWKGVRAQMVFTEAHRCYYRTASDFNLYVKSCNTQDSSGYTLHEDSADYFNIGNGNRAYEHNGLSLWNGRLYFTSVNVLYSMNPDGGDLRREYAHDIPGTGKFILGSFVSGDQAYLTMSDYQYNLSAQQIPLEPTGYHVHEYRKEVVAPTCLESGYTLYTCDCGVSYKGDPVPAAGHQYEKTILKKASFSQEGLAEMKCTGCGDSYQEPIPVLTPRTFLEANPYIIVIGLAIPVVTFFVVFFLVMRKNKKKQ